MTTPYTPKTAATASNHVISASVALAARLGMEGRFDYDVIKIIGKLLDPPGHTNDTVVKALDTLFTDHWEVRTWSDLECFRSEDVSAALTADGVHDLFVALTAPVVIRKLGYVVNYAAIGTLTPDLSMNEIIHRVRAGAEVLSVEDAYRVGFDQKAVPTIDKFTGHEEDYFTWRESTIDELAAAGFDRLLEDKSMVDEHPHVAERVFYALRGAILGGPVQSIAQTMLDNKTFDPYALWQGLEDYYNTAQNRAKVVLFEIQRLLNLRLDPDTTATNFVSDFRDCLQRLRKINARLADDDATLRVILARAIQDNDFEAVQDTIVKDPNRNLDAILTDLLKRETWLMMKDHASNIEGGGNASYTPRRKRSFNNQQSNRQSEGSKRYKRGRKRQGGERRHCRSS